LVPRIESLEPKPTTNSNNTNKSLRNSQDPGLSLRPVITVYYTGAAKPKVLPDYLKDASLHDIVEAFMSDTAQCMPLLLDSLLEFFSFFLSFFLSLFISVFRTFFISYFLYFSSFQSFHLIL
jgi:hypothetical protein